MEEGQERNRPRTLYTLTLLEILTDAAKRQKDKELRHAIREAAGRGFRKAEVLDYASERLDSQAMQHLKSVIASMTRGSRKAG